MGGDPSTNEHYLGTTVGSIFLRIFHSDSQCVIDYNAAIAIGTYELLDGFYASNVKTNFWGFDLSDRFVVRCA